ncbi:Membrane protein implicated in regulation of membrane protease activity [Duganella sp. CF517]|nr:Membrane protein implicated in regulation of membrane protease activity [Duganella sp. CF517]
MWLAVAGALVALELFVGTFYLLMVALGALAAALVALLRIDMPVQMLAAAIVGVVATLLLRRSRFGKRTKLDAMRDPNVNLDIGQAVQVAHWDHGAARVMYRGAQWDVELAPGAAAQAGRFIIREVRGSTLIVGH